ncbi:MAG: hypothetical protein NTV80_01225, partial [Verrucomicrobia bacterium]|nr:hypothetical protein [Verrucomicrobiota bacterium]
MKNIFQSHKQFESAFLIITRPSSLICTLMFSIFTTLGLPNLCLSQTAEDIAGQIAQIEGELGNLQQANADLSQQATDLAAQISS